MYVPLNGKPEDKKSTVNMRKVNVVTHSSWLVLHVCERYYFTYWQLVVARLKTNPCSTWGISALNKKHVCHSKTAHCVPLCIMYSCTHGLLYKKPQQVAHLRRAPSDWYSLQCCVTDFVWSLLNLRLAKVLFH